MARKYKETPPAKVEENLPVVAGVFEGDADKGMEGADAQSFSIPYLMILQKNSPQCDKDDGKYIKGAEAGMLYNSVTKDVYDPETHDILVAPAYFQHKMVEWVPRDQGGGFAGQYEPDAPIVKSAIRNETGKFELENGNYLSDTRYHFCILIKPDGDITFCILSLSSTQIKKSRDWLSIMRDIKFVGSKGKFTPPTFAHLFKISTVPEENEKGKWRGWKIQMERALNPKDAGDLNIYMNAKKLNEMCKAGSVNVAPPPPQGDDTDAGTTTAF